MSWPMVKLKDVASFVRGITFKPDDVIPVDSAGAVACMRTKNVQEQIDLSDVWGIPRSFVKRPDQFVREGDLLVSTANSWNLVGKCSWVPVLPWPTTVGGFIAALRGGDRIDPRYLYHWFASSDVQLRVRNCARQTTNIANLSFDRCLDLDLPLPPLPEQRRLAAILDQADDLRRKQSRSTYLAGTLEQALFRETFGGAEQPSVTSTSLGPHISFVTSGGRGWAKYYSDHGERFIRSMDVRMGYISEDEPAFVNVKPSAETRRTKIQDNDILLTITGSRIGRVAHVPIDWGCGYISQHVAIIRLNRERLDPRFVAFYMTLPEGGQRQILKMQYGQSKPGLNFDQIARFQIPVPSLADQAEFLNDLDQLQTVQTAQAHAAVDTEALFTSLQHRAFRGEL